MIEISGNIHSARDPYLGYLYQGLYALVIILESKDDDSKIYLETRDDVVLNGKEENLYQIKHRNDKIKQLTIKSEDLWKTIEIWTHEKDLELTKFILITCDNIKDDNILKQLENIKRDVKNLNKKLSEEAKRVLNEREKAEKKGISLPYEKRCKGCMSFLELSEVEKERLLEKIFIKTSCRNISEIEEIISEKLFSVTRELRGKVTKGLLEWWSFRIIEILRSEKLNFITANEVQKKIEYLIHSYYEVKYPITYLNKEPENNEMNELSKLYLNIIRQIDLVEGGNQRKIRAFKDIWSTRSQRKEWIEEDISVTDKIKKFENCLKKHWENKFEVMRDDCKNSSELEKIEVGKKILDWSYEHAYNTLPLENDIKHWKEIFLVHGSYQILSEQLKIGWHPDYKKIDSEGK